MRIALASGLTAIALFFFGFVWWGILMPIVRPANVITNSNLVEAMGLSLNESGLYFHPSYAEPDETQSSPAVMLFFNTAPPSMPQMMGMGFAHMLISAFIVSIGISLLSRPTFMERFAIVFSLGVFVAVWADIGNLIWWRHPFAWTAFHFAYDLISWAIAGVIIASLVKPSVDAT